MDIATEKRYDIFAEENSAYIKEAGIDCKNSRVGDYKCAVKTRLGWCCDVCLENELLWLNSQGVHTINSCCGHGNKQLASILVAGENSKQFMGEHGYIEAEIQPGDARMRAYVPKTPMPYESN